jgi:hypothetical protein
VALAARLVLKEVVVFVVRWLTTASAVDDVALAEAGRTLVAVQLVTT